MLDNVDRPCIQHKNTVFRPMLLRLAPGLRTQHTSVQLRQPPSTFGAGAHAQKLLLRHCYVTVYYAIYIVIPTYPSLQGSQGFTKILTLQYMYLITNAVCILMLNPNGLNILGQCGTHEQEYHLGARETAWETNDTRSASPLRLRRCRTPRLSQPRASSNNYRLPRASANGGAIAIKRHPINALRSSTLSNPCSSNANVLHTLSNRERSPVVNSPKSMVFNQLSPIMNDLQSMHSSTVNTFQP